MALKILYGASIGAVSFITFATLTGFAGPFGSYRQDPSHNMDHSSALAQAALDRMIHNAKPIFGNYESSQLSTSTWMRDYSDDTEIVQMNIPGTHDTATWNYSEATQVAMTTITDLVNPDARVDSTFFRCQQRPIIDMLDAGIRAFDLRYAPDVTKSTLVFWHGKALQSQVATVEDVLFGFYRWLDDHPSEALFLSMKFEGNSEMKNEDNSGVQQLIYDILTTPVAKKYFLQRRNGFGTLGEARGKITLLRRFDLDMLSPEHEETIAGVHFSPSKWTDNGKNISLEYDEEKHSTAYIQDYYHPETQIGSSLAANIDEKFDATTTHLLYATKSHPEALFWNFASSTKTENTPPNTPRLQALGDGVTPGVNQRLMSFLEGMKGKRLGILLFDFYDEPEGLVPLYLSLLQEQ